MANPSLRIPIPTNPDNQITLAKDILKKHTSLGTKSPLAGIDMDSFQSQTDVAAAQHALAKDLARQAETATQTRDGALGPQKGTEKPGTVKFFLRACRDTLAGQNRGNEKKLGDFGFTVDDSPRRAVAKTKPPAA